MDEYDEIEESEKNKDYENIISILAFISTWFIRLGLALGAILLIYFIVMGKFLTAIVYIIGMLTAYFFGYFFMFCLDTFLSSK